MDKVVDVINFILLDGLMLVILFLGISMLIFLAQQFSLGRSIEVKLANASSWNGATLAAIGGAVTPFCSCSTVPVLSGMLRSKIGLASCFTFLISSPVINEGVIILLVSGPGFGSAVIFVLSAALLSILAGILVERTGMIRFLRPLGTVAVPEGYMGDSTGEVSRPKFRTALSFSWGAARMELRQIMPYLVIGIIIGGLIHGYMPENILTDLDHTFPPYFLIPLVALIAVPLYISPMAIVPIGYALIEKGMDPGPLVALLISGAGTSLPEMILLLRLFRWPLIVAHIVAVVTAAVILGFLAQWTIPNF